ncbi:hypothetical protein BB559_003097 [Furculomyces boomerangus]|uniref:Uncharacterized protein n=1 Tax=Furculomyces boomerangus TaxID=61424 RepID=A0A2T9YP54_9FUNG|nr:hypothetical protein BB559_003097 [Furculomyces boomerangus]
MLPTLAVLKGYTANEVFKRKPLVEAYLSQNLYIRKVFPMQSGDNESEKFTENWNDTDKSTPRYFIKKDDKKPDENLYREAIRGDLANPFIDNVSERLFMFQRDSF